MTVSRRPARVCSAPPVDDPAAIGPRLARSAFAVPAAVLAPWLIGRLLVRRLDDGGVLAGRIVETEAYVGIQDRASHAFGGRRTDRNEVMYGPPGLAYVYFTYGMHHCFNVVCGQPEEPAAVLIRALEPLVGLEKMAELRKRSAKRRPGKAVSLGPSSPAFLCGGPARLCQAMMIDRRLNGADLTSHVAVFVAESPVPARPRLVRAPRVGVDYAGAWAARKLRWLARDSAAVSVPVRREARERRN